VRTNERTKLIISFSELVQETCGNMATVHERNSTTLLRVCKFLSTSLHRHTRPTELRVGATISHFLFKTMDSRSRQCACILFICTYPLLLKALLFFSGFFAVDPSQNTKTIALRWAINCAALSRILKISLFSPIGLRSFDLLALRLI